jgi:FkbM family methyltransferase
MARRAGKSGTVIAFEPSPHILRFLRSTLAANRELAIELVEVALGLEESVLSLRVPEGNAGRASLVPSDRAGAEFDVPVRRLASVLKERGLHRIDVMKIDVEGFEFEALSGLLDDVSAPRPGVIVFEENSPRDNRTFSLLVNCGYTLFGIPKGSLFSIRLCSQDAPGFMECHDFLALAPDLPSKRIAALRLP